MDLEGKLAVVTGASSGIGREIALTLAGRGARLVVIARSAPKLLELSREVGEAGGTAGVYPADLSRPEEIQRVAAEILAGPGVPDLLVNNAGAGRWRAIDELAPNEVQMQTALPYLAAYNLTQELITPMIERGSGWILNVTSLAGYIRLPGASAYAVARWAMRAFSYQLEADLRGTGIGVTLLAPAEVDSPYFDNNPGSRERIPRIAGPMIGTITPEQVGAEAVRAVERERREWIIPWRARWMMRLTPGRLLDYLTVSTGWKRGTPEPDADPRDPV